MDTIDNQLRDAILIARNWYLSRLGSGVCRSLPGGIQELSAVLYASWYAALRTPKRLEMPRTPLVSALQASSTARGIGQRATSPHYSETLMPEYLVAFSSGWFAQAGLIARVYWNISPHAASQLITQVTPQTAGVAYCIKVPTKPIGFCRSDAAVLYLPFAAFQRIIGRVRFVANRLQPALSAEIPCLTYRIAHGVGLAESPSNAAESFGQHRCRLIAEALLLSNQLCFADRSATLQTVKDQFVKHGIEPRTPWRERTMARDPNQSASGTNDPE